MSRGGFPQRRKGAEEAQSEPIGGWRGLPRRGKVAFVASGVLLVGGVPGGCVTDGAAWAVVAVVLAVGLGLYGMAVGFESGE